MCPPLRRRAVKEILPMSFLPFARAAAGLALAGLAIASPVSAHVVLEAHEAPAHSYFKAQFLAGHGCDGSSTVSIEVTIPEGVVGVKPMPKPGWTLTIADGAYAHPQQVHGKTVSSGVASVTWSGGPLPDAWADEFTLMAQLPDRPAGAGVLFPGRAEVRERRAPRDRDPGRRRAKAAAQGAGARPDAHPARTL